MIFFICILKKHYFRYVHSLSIDTVTNHSKDNSNLLSYSSGSQTQNEPHNAEIKVLTRLCFFPEVPSSCFFSSWRWPALLGWWPLPPPSKPTATGIFYSLHCSNTDPLPPLPHLRDTCYYTWDHWIISYDLTILRSVDQEPYFYMEPSLSFFHVANTSTGSGD